ncbi:efflux transporter outer membrane subunit [Flavihumibacter sp. ZG627]|uniref:efflux transporter outer membrane subunit n=1 Tax=Flavihumibacter sp. ZG627 TaxID=1463156 RepID=UPI00057C72E2|nr:efflux transporter outer membrane subunit [Flavihumibacter sp. ZG627]KIC91921.1 membrane protein [Flavihumibacter sp. ZG627]
MNKKISQYIFLIVTGSLLFVSCKVTEPYTAQESLPFDQYRDQQQTDSSNIASISRNEFFTDPILQAYIDSGISNNLDLQMAMMRIQQSQSYYSQSKAAFLPSLNANASFTESKLSEAQGFGIRTSATQFVLGVTSDWEADIWGKLRSSRKASLASLLQTEMASKAIQTRLVADIANYYYLLLALDEQLAITRQTVINWDTTVQTMRALKEAASVTEAAVVQSEAQRYAAEVTIPDLKQSIRETENALSILLGRAPGAIERSSLQSQQMVAALQTGVPAQLLVNRPDVQQAELNFRYYFEMTNVARSFFYPSLTINASAGLSSLALADFLDPASFAASIGAGILQPIFNRRLNRTRLEVARSQQQEALLGFRNTLLNAGREVSDAISLYENAGEKISIRTLQMDALQKSVDFSEELLQNGFANYIEIINARQSLLLAELGKVNDRLQQLQSGVNLYRSLGGGWKN